MKQHDTVDDIGVMQKYKAALAAGIGSAELAKALYEHCQQCHQVNGLPTKLRWPEPEQKWIISEPNYFAINNVAVTECSVAVDIRPIPKRFYVPDALSEEEAGIIDLKDTLRQSGASAGQPVYMRFKIIRSDQLELAYRVLDHAHLLKCRQLTRSKR